MIFTIVWKQKTKKKEIFTNTLTVTYNANTPDTYLEILVCKSTRIGTNERVSISSEHVERLNEYIFSIPFSPQYVINSYRIKLNKLVL